MSTKIPMPPIFTLLHGINVMPLAMALHRNPQLWNENRARTERSDSPHREVDDIWLRYAEGGWEEGETAHESQWLSAVYSLPEAKPLARSIMAHVQGDSLGGILITRIPPGRRVYPHKDLGWHALHYDKFALQLTAHPQQAFCYDNARHVTASGDLYWFNNQETHWVVNDSPVDRITMIVCVRMDKPFGGGHYAV